MEYVATMCHGKKVYYDPHGPAATHFEDTPNLLALVKNFLTQQSFNDPVVYIEHDAGRNVGLTDLVETTAADTIVYAKRLHRNSYTVFAKNRKPSPTNFFTVALQMDTQGDYELASAWIGRICPNAPDEPNATADSKPFWSTHALAWGTQAVQPETETTVCPW